MITPEAIAYQQYCPRRRFWGFECKGGLEPTLPKVNYAVERAVRLALQFWFAGAKAAAAVSKAEMLFSSMASGGLDIGPDEDAAKVVEEQTALCGAIVMNYIELHGPNFKQQFESKILDLGAGVQIENAGPDAIQIVHHETLDGLESEVLATFLRVVAGSYDIDSYADRHRIVAGVINAERVLGQPVRAQIQYLYKGKRTNRGQHSPLIRGYQHKQTVDFEYRHGWAVIKTWEAPGTPMWLQMLPKAIRLAQIHTVTDETDFSLIQMLSEDGKREWIEQVKYQETGVNQISTFTRIDAEFDIDRFPQFRHSCPYCEFRKVCDQRIDRPEAGYGYQLKRRDI